MLDGSEYNSRGRVCDLAWYILDMLFLCFATYDALTSFHDGHVDWIKRRMEPVLSSLLGIGNWEDENGPILSLPWLGYLVNVEGTELKK